MHMTHHLLSSCKQIFFKHNQDKLEKIGEHKTDADAIMGLDIHPEVNNTNILDYSNSI